MRLTDHDASFLYAETASGPMHGANIAVVQGELSADQVRRHVASRLHLVPRLRQRLCFVPFNLAHPKWVDDPKFDLSNHVRGHQLPDGATLDDALAAAMALAEPLMPRDRPLWLTYVIEGVPDRTVLLQMGHHVMADGASGVDISLALFDLQAKAPPPKQAPPWRPAPLPSPMELAAEAMREQAESALGRNFADLGAWRGERLEMLRRAGESMTRFIAEPVLLAPWNAGLVGPKRQFAWRRYSFADFRKVRRRFGGTINDLVLAAVAEGAARYLAARKARAKGWNLRLMCPVNVRRQDEQGALGNRVSGIFPVFSAQPMDILERLRYVREELEQIKQNREAQAMHLLMESAPSPPPPLMAPALLVGGPWDPTALAARSPLPPLPQLGAPMPMLGFNFTCTNVPGVQVPQYIAGHQVLDNMALLMLGGALGYGVAVTSYNHRLTFNFVCEPRLMPDLQLMVDCVEGAFTDLLARAEEAEQRKQQAKGAHVAEDAAAAPSAGFVSALQRHEQHREKIHPA